MSATGTELSESLAGLHRAAEDLRVEADRLADALRGRNRHLRSSMAISGSSSGQAMAQPRGGPAYALLPQVIAAFVPIAAFALIEVHLALAMAVALTGVVLLQVRWWMLAVSTLSMVVVLLIEPGLREGVTLDRIAALITLFALMTIALLLQETWQRLRRRTKTGEASRPRSL